MFLKSVSFAGCLLLGITSGYSQITKIHRKSRTGIEIGTGLCQHGTVFSGSCVKYVTPCTNQRRKIKTFRPRPVGMPFPCLKRRGISMHNRSYLKVTFGYEAGARYEGVVAEVAACYNILNVKNRFFTSLKGGLPVSAGKLEQQTAETASGKGVVRRQTTAGVLVGIENEVLLSSRWSVVAGADQRYLMSRYRLGIQPWYVYGAIRLNVN